MFAKNIIIALAFLIVSLNGKSLAFDLRSIKYAQGNDFWTVDVPCTGGSGQYSFEYELPSGWKFQNNRIKIPSSATQQVGSQYAIRCRVKDTMKGDILERSLIFKPFSQGSSYSLEVSDHDYFYGKVGANAYEASGSSIHGIDVLKRLGALVKNTGSFGMDFSGGSYHGAGVEAGVGIGIGGGAGLLGQHRSGSANYGADYFGSGSGSKSGSGLSSGSYSPSSSSLSSYSSSQSSSTLRSSSSSSSSSFSNSGSISDSSQFGGVSIYNSLPSISQLEKYINNGAIVEIIQTIQLVVDSKIKCEAKSAYLSDFLGRIYSAIEVKKFTLNQLKTIVTTALTQVQKLTIQINTIKNQQAVLNLTELKKTLDQLVIKLKAAYDEYNNFSSNSFSYETEIITLEKEINEFDIKYNEVQMNLQKWRRTVQSIDSEIAEYQTKIRQLKEKRSIVIQDITSAETFIREKDIRIREIRQKIAVIKAKISTVSTLKQTLKKTYLELEVRVNSAKSSYESANAQFVKFEQQITSITVEIERYQKQTSELQVKQVTQAIENLQSAITEIKSSIDFVQFKCFNAVDIQIDNDSKEKCPSYHFGQKQWFGYINNCYSDLAEQIRNRIAQAFKNQVIEISTVNIFSDLWKQNYGSVFERDIAIKGQNYRSDTSLNFESDFSCADGLQILEARSGIIQDIRSNAVSVRGDDGREYSLRLGSCSRFEGQGKSFLPRKGQNILWKGSKNGGSFNLHTCTCY